MQYVNNIPFHCKLCDTFSACAEFIRVLAAQWPIETRNQLLYEVQRSCGSVLFFRAYFADIGLLFSMLASG